MTCSRYALHPLDNTVSATFFCSPRVTSLRARQQHGRRSFAGAGLKRVYRALTWSNTTYRALLPGPSMAPAPSNYNFEQFNTLTLLALKEHLDRQRRLELQKRDQEREKQSAAEDRWLLFWALMLPLFLIFYLNILARHLDDQLAHWPGACWRWCLALLA